MQPIQEEGSTDIAPFDMPGIAHQGEESLRERTAASIATRSRYARPVSGADLARGWGTAKDGDGKGRHAPQLSARLPSGRARVSSASTGTAVT